MVNRNRNKNVRRNRNARRAKDAPQMQLAPRLNLLRTNNSFVNISYPVFMYAYTTTDLYSFSTGADQRTFTFAQITGATEFTNFAGVYSQYRIKSVSIIVQPLKLSTVTNSYPMLVIGCDPEIASPANPTNSSFILRDTNHFFSANALMPKSVTYNLAQIGTTTHIWKSTSDSPGGTLLFGNNTGTGIFGGGNQLVWEMYISLLVEFSNAK